MGLLQWLGVARETETERELRQRRLLAEATKAEAQAETARLRQAEKSFNLDVARMAKDAGNLELAVGIVRGAPIPNGRRTTSAPASSPMEALALELMSSMIRDTIKRDPMEEYEAREAQMERMEERFLKRQRRLEGKSDAPEGWMGFVQQLADTELGKAVGQSIAPLIAGAAAGGAQPGAGAARISPAGVPAPGAPGAPYAQHQLPPPAAAAPAQASASSAGVNDPTTPEEILGAFEQYPAEQLAPAIVRWEQINPRVAQFVHLLLESSDQDVEQQLQAYAKIPDFVAGGWPKVARWLLEHAEKRAQLTAAVRQLKMGGAVPAGDAGGAMGAPAPVQVMNGYANGHMNGHVNGYAGPPPGSTGGL